MTRRAAIVTGANRGIGLAVSTMLSAAGFDLLAADLAPVPSEALQAGVERNNSRLAYRAFDLADLSTHAAIVEAGENEFGGIDCLVNNAGIGSVVRGDFLELRPENFDTVIATNLRGTIFFTQAVVKAMLGRPERTARTIINITSVSTELSSPERLDYCISKAGLSSFTQGLALRLAETGISVFEVRPGIIRTDMTAGVAAKYDALIGGGLVPMKRWGEAGDVGAICASLAQGGFGFATGSIINADGGLSIQRL